MVEDVLNINNIQLAELPYRFEAGTINLGGIVSLGAAIDFMKGIDLEPLSKTLKVTLANNPYLKLIVEPEGPIVSFQLEDIHPHDVAQILASDGICVRAGYHCAQPLLEEIGPVTRVSLGVHNTEEDIEYLAKKLATIRQRMGYA